MIPNPTPKERFIAIKNAASNHRELIALDQFQLSADYAILEYQRMLAMTPFDNYNALAASQMRMTGALEFLQQFRNLAETTPPTKREVAGNLDHKA